MTRSSRSRPAWRLWRERSDSVWTQWQASACPDWAAGEASGSGRAAPDRIPEPDAAPDSVLRSVAGSVPSAGCTGRRATELTSPLSPKTSSGMRSPALPRDGNPGRMQRTLDAMDRAPYSCRTRTSVNIAGRGALSCGFSQKQPKNAVLNILAGDFRGSGRRPAMATGSSRLLTERRRRTGRSRSCETKPCSPRCCMRPVCPGLAAAPEAAGAAGETSGQRGQGKKNCNRRREPSLRLMKRRRQKGR